MTNLKRDSSVEKFIGKDSDAPNVDFAIVREFLDDLGRCVDGSAALGGP